MTQFWLVVFVTFFSGNNNLEEHARGKEREGKVSIDFGRENGVNFVPCQMRLKSLKGSDNTVLVFVFVIPLAR